MKNFLVRTLAIAAFAPAVSCISVTTVKKVADHPDAKGQRYYLPQVYLIGKPGKDGSIEYTKFVSRDETAEYAVNTWTLFGKHTMSLDYEKDAPGVLKKFETKQYTDTVPEKFIGAAGEIVKAELEARKAAEKAQDDKIAAASKALAEKQLAVDKAKIALDAAPDATKQIAYDQAIAERDFARTQLRQLVGANTKSGGAAPKPTAMTPVVYRLEDDGKGRIRLVNVPYRTFVAKTGAKGTESKFVKLGNQLVVSSSKSRKDKPEMPPSAPPSVGISGDLIKRVEGRLSQKPLDLVLDTPFPDVAVSSVFQVKQPDDQLQSIEKKPTITKTNPDNRHYSLRFPPDFAAGSYEVNLLFSGGEKPNAELPYLFKVTVE
ncbi:hypothetical protein KBB96_04855 [Luteolibacter ambystomatis]|uniref:DUF4831 family protein n=1 Tax=Luteolibacter ambystomatis TaxID=2824561 RepID=A0A975J1C3_9BACT|nr:hypothetical protein [Luteolibacter ambystomatis]QUE52222.1 hypothetical protein KBB96_04855 [Luteolibacter ambystomatis]